MHSLSRILDELTGGVTRLPWGKVRSRDLPRKSPCRLGYIGREVEELEDRVVPTLLGQQLFPSNYPWNQNIANAPITSNSTAIIDHIGATVTIHPDWGTDSPANGTDPLYGIPINIVHGNTAAKVNVIIDNYNSESDVVAVPMPANPVIEGDYQDGPNPNGPGYGPGERGDSHLIIWDEDNNIAYEFYEAARPSDPVLGDGSPHTDGQWHAFQESVWNMNTDEFRTIGYTSADAAGLSILAGLARPDEALPVSDGGQGAIDHALRFTLPGGDVNPQYIYPASHMVNESQSSLSLPLGARLRLASTPAINTLINTMGPEAKAIAIAMQQYGLILADIGSPMYVTGTSGSVDANNSLNLVWDMNDVLGLESLTASDFQVVNLTPIVTSLSVASGSAGNTISVVGQNFSGAAGDLSVFFGTTIASSVTVVSDSQLSVVVPSGSGTVNVTVQSGVNEIDDYSDNPDANVTEPIFGYGTSATSSADLFTFSDQTISGTNSTVSFASPTDTSGTTDLVTIVVKDTADDPVTGLSSNAFLLGLTGGTSTGSFGTVTETTTPGTYTTTFSGQLAGTAATLTTSVSGVSITPQPSVQVNAGSVDGSNSTVNFASSTDQINNPDVVTIVVKDAAGNAITGLSSSDFVFSLSGGTSTGLFGTVSGTTTSGSYTATFTGLAAGTVATLTLKVNGVSITTQPTVQVTPLPISGTNSTVIFASSTDVSGTTDLVTIVVKDTGNNAVTGLSNNAFGLSLSGGTSTGSFGTVSETTTHGTYTATFTGNIAGTAATLTLKVNGVSISTQPTVQVTAGSVGGSNSTVSFATPTVAVGNPDVVTIIVKDAAGNAISGLANDAFAFSLSAGASSGSFGMVSETTTHGTYTAIFTGVTAGNAATLTLKVNGISITTQPTVQVTPLPISGTNSSVSFSHSTDSSGTTDLVTIVVKDTANHAVAVLPSNAFVLSLSGGTSTGSFGAVTETTTAGTYTGTFMGLTAGTATTLSTTVSGVVLTTLPSVQVSAGSVSGSKSTVTVTTPTDASDTTDAVTIVIKDAAGNAITGLASSTFIFSLTGGTSTGSFGPMTETTIAGTYTAAFTGVIAGTAATLTATVGGVGIVTQSTVAVTPGVVSLFTSTTMVSPSSIPVGNTTTLTLITRDAVGNPESTGGLAVAFGLVPGSAGGSFSGATDNGNGTYSTTFTATSAGSDTFTTVIGSQPITSAASVVTVTASPPVVPPPPSVSINPNLVGFSDIAVGADAGGSSVVTVYNPNGSVAYTLNPFPGFTGGVRTAVGDFNGDGTQDVVAGTGPGITAEVKVFDGKTGAMMFDVQPFGTFQGGVFVAAGDIVGDGKSDLVITPDQSGGPRVEIYHGGDFTEMDNFYGINDPGFRGGARAALGDINGDGHADLVVSAGFGGGPRISVYDGAALAQGQQVNLVGDFYAFSSELRNGAYVAVGDVNGDGHADLIFGAGPGGGPEVLVVDGETLLTQGAVAAVGDPIANFYAGDPNNRGGIRVAVKNLDGSANASVITGAGPGGGSQVTAYLGKDLAVGSATTAFGMEAFPGFSGGVFVG